MLRSLLMAGLFCAVLAPFAKAEEQRKSVPNGSANIGFEKLKSLVGTWVAADDQGNPTDQVISVIRLTAAGSAIHETIFPGQQEEMVSIYTADGSDVVMTHYCMLGNQPRMKANGQSPGNQLLFEFDGGTNLDPAKDLHMHSAVLKFVDDDHLEVHGTVWEDGRPAKDMCNGFKLVRKKE